ncbi:MAG: serine--tRNA ligase [Myxococcales bacterium]|nr:serine--tRNA ligase [Myxococcales bacterium]
MLDIKYVVNNADAVEINCKQRLMPADIGSLVATYRERNAAITEMEQVRQEMNANARSMKQRLEPEERQAKITRGRELKTQVADLDTRAQELKQSVDTQLRRLPNLTHPQTPIGHDDEDNKELRIWGTPPKFEFDALDHVELGRRLDLLDFESGAAVAGQKFYFLRNEMVLLDLALQRYAVDILIEHGFTPMVTPDLARPEILEGIGFNPRGAETQVYNIEGHDLCLVGTAEITIGGMLRDRVIPAEQLPIRVAGISHCFRTEAGAAGRESRGLYRVHQFTKVEMFIFCGDGEGADGRPASETHHDELVAIEEQMLQGLEIPYRVVDVCTGDLGAPAYRKYDIEAWMPGRGMYGEVTSTSNCLDFQARRLGIRSKTTAGPKSKPRFVHTLNGTAVALSRTLIALLENHQQADGSIRMPAGLQRYLPFTEIRPKG